jgi:hypothetical protein
VEGVYARKWKLYAPTQDTALTYGAGFCDEGIEYSGYNREIRY